MQVHGCLTLGDVKVTEAMDATKASTELLLGVSSDAVVPEEWGGAQGYVTHRGAPLLLHQVP